MPDIGLFELLVIGILLFVVVGPERMPEFFGHLGSWARHARNWWSQVSGEFSREVEQGAAPLKDMAGEMQQGLDGIRQEVEQSVSDSAGRNGEKPDRHE